MLSDVKGAECAAVRRAACSGSVMTARPGTTIALLTWLAAAVGCASLARADEAAILRDLAAFFDAADLDLRERLARRIEEDAAYDRAKIGAWLHAAIPFEPRPPGQAALAVPLADGATRRVALRLPAGYDARQPWPLIYALHGQGGGAGQIIAYVEQALGPHANEYVVAAPDRYDEVVVHQTRWPPTGEHPTVLHALKRAVHVDSDRVFALGYSRGGHTSWTLAVLHADQFAGVAPVAGTLLMQEVDRLWEHLLGNLMNTRVLCVWGAQDTLDDGGAAGDQHGIAGLNRLLAAMTNRLKAPVVVHEDPHKGHGGVVPPPALLEDLLASRRAHDPKAVRQTFRHIYQARCYWLEGHAWRGPQWTDKPIELRFQPGEDASREEDVRQAFTRAFKALLGEISGEVDGQEIRVSRKNVSKLTVWIGADMLDWSRPVTLTVSGRQAFEGTLTPDLFVCLAQAQRTYDFERLRWAGLRFKSGSRTKLVTGRTEFAGFGVDPSTGELR